MSKMNKALQLIMMCAALCFVAPIHASDVSISPTGPVYQVNNLKWGCSGAGCINNNFFFSPSVSNGSICVFVYNSNPTNGHTFNVQLKYSGDPGNSSPSDGTWNAYGGVAAQVVGTSPSGPAVVGISTSGVALVSVNITSSTTAGGSPDTANVRIVQSNGGQCTVAPTPDPCQNPLNVKMSASTGTGTGVAVTPLVGGISGQTIYLCSYDIAIDANATPSTVQLGFWQGANCNGSPTRFISPLIESNTAQQVLHNVGPGHTISLQFSSPVGQLECLGVQTTGAMALGYYSFITFVQQ